MQMKPSIAKSWSLSSDRLTYEFHLRTDIYFHDHPAFKEGKGRKLNAQDVVYSFKRLMQSSVASPGAWIFNNRVDPEKGFEAVNDSVFRLHLIRPFVQMLGVLSNVYCSVVPREAVEWGERSFGQYPCGTGPFRFFLWEEGQVLLLKKHSRYFEIDSGGNRLPYLDGVKISFLSSKAAEFLEFRQHRLDFMNDIDPSFKDELLSRGGVLREKWNKEMVLMKHPYLNVEYLGILVDSMQEITKASPLRYRQIRQAINYAIDRRKLMLYLRNSIGMPAESGFIPPGLPGFDSVRLKGYTYQPDRAKSMLLSLQKEKQIRIQLLTVPVYADFANALSKDLNAIGLSVQVEVLQKSVLLTRTANRQAEFFRASWIADYPDAENFMGLFYSKYPSPPNYTRYSNAAFDQLYEASMNEPDDSLRYGMYKKMDSMIVADAPVVPLWYDEVINFIQPGIQGFVPNALNIPDLRRVRKIH